ncbi:MAG: GTPase HflX [Planctomycetota bacterium]
MESGVREQLNVASEPAVLVACLLPDTQTNPHDPLDELRALAESAGAVVVDEMLQKRQKPSAKSLIGKGKVQELAERVKLHNAQVVIFENDLSPSQIGNIERVCEVKVLDRSELILDIFADRARTHEARLQVELAQLEYTYPRLRAMWTHLERIAGGAPAGIGTRGPGEQQLEIDRRIVQRKKALLKRELVDVQSRKTREVESRNADHFTVGLVGYTNAGKSTLFNTLTEASGGGGAYAADQLFATLGTRTRQWRLGDGDRVMLSDTVGFVRDLPHHLVASFKATLEEAVHSDLLLLVLDVADPHCRRHLDTVNRVLDDIGAADQPRLLVLNKIDKVDHNADLLLLQKQHPEAIALSAATGRGMEALVEAVRGHLHGGLATLTLDVAQADGKTLSFLENRATVLDRDYRDDRVAMTVRIGQRQLDKLRAMGGTAVIPADELAAAGWGR